MVKNIYEYGKCSYCDEINRVLRPTPFMADSIAKAMMCEFCWGSTKKEYVDIDKFDSCEGYSEVKDQVVDNESLKEILEDIVSISDQDSPIEELALRRIKELETENKIIRHDLEILKKIRDKRTLQAAKLSLENRELVIAIKNFIETLKDIKGFTGDRKKQNELIKCLIDNMEKVREGE